MTVPVSARPTPAARSTGWVPFLLVALVMVPAAAGTLRLVGWGINLAVAEYVIRRRPAIRATAKVGTS